MELLQTILLILILLILIGMIVVGVLFYIKANNFIKDSGGVIPTMNGKFLNNSDELNNK